MGKALPHRGGRGLPGGRGLAGTRGAARGMAGAPREGARAQRERSSGAGAGVRSSGGIRGSVALSENSGVQGAEFRNGCEEILRLANCS